MCCRMVGCLGALLCASVAIPAQAGLIERGWNPDTPTAATIVWGWDPETDDAVESTSPFGNWLAYLNITTFQMNPRVYKAHWEFQHLVAPHPGDVAGQRVSFESVFAGDALDVVINQWGSIPHPNAHVDYWHFVFDRSAWSPATSIRLELVHPEPITLGFMIPVAAMVFRRRR